MELEGKTILISGVGPGLGGACAAAALRDGANVIATARNLDRLQGAVAELDPGGERTLAMAADKVPNLRLILASALQRAAPHLAPDTLVQRAIPTLEALERDDDIDVLGAAREALEVCHSLAHRSN